MIGTSIVGSTSVNEPRDRVVEGFPGPAGSARIQKVFGEDDRVRVATTDFPQSAQCKLVITFPNREQFIGSATLIDARHALTAGHCVHNNDRGGWATRIEVIPALDGTYKPYGSVYASNICI